MEKSGIPKRLKPSNIKNLTKTTPSTYAEPPETQTTQGKGIGGAAVDT
jgi:hypothetical protein